jgi:hypothetical protein
MKNPTMSRLCNKTLKDAISIANCHHSTTLQTTAQTIFAKKYAY